MRLLLALLALSCALPLQAQLRVVSLTPSLNELMVELQAEELLVGIVDGGLQVPPALDRLPRLGRMGQVEMEGLLALRPDLVLLWPDSMNAGQREQLRAFGIQLFESYPRTLDELPPQIRALGTQIGREPRAEQLADEITARLRQMRERYHREQPLQVFYQVWDRPLYTVGGRQFISDALEVCGARNVFAELALPAPQVSVEAVLARDPDVILSGEAHLVEGWQRWPQLRAVRLGQLKVVPDRGLERPSAQIIDATQKLCELLEFAEGR